MKQIDKKVIRVLEIQEENDLEIISFGLAPNANGFCYEKDGEVPQEIEQGFNDLLWEIEASSKLTNQLRRELF